MLLARMQTAMSSAGSAAATISSAPVRTSGPMRERITGSLTVSSRLSRMHLLMHTTVTTTGSHPVTVTGTFETVAVGGKLAQRENRMRWGCQTIEPSTQPQVYVYTFELPRPALRVTTLGSGTIRGTPVWRLEVAPDPKHTNLGPATLFIAHETNRLLRESLVFGTQGSTPGPVTVLLDYGHYGEPVTVALPAACSS
jgi:hypothetical protein